jgi:hypothetical protein
MLLQGDELSVQLFIGAAALTALSVAMTQAGWTQRWFVRGMFALAALLTIACVGWPYFESRIPLISDALEVVALSRVGWFFVGIIPALIGGMFLSDFLPNRRRPATNPSAIVWWSIFDAMENLARQDLLDRYEYVKKQVYANARQATSLQDRISELEAATPALEEARRTEAIDELVKLASEYAKVSKESQPLGNTEENCREALRMNILDQLLDGKLIAKGFLAPHNAGAPEKVIPKEEWRFLMLDWEGDQALGPNFEYIAVLIGKPGD